MTATLLLIALSLFCGGWVKGVFGMGPPTVSMGLLSLSMSPIEAATLIVVPTVATNVWQFGTGPRPGAVAPRFSVLLLGVLAGTALGIGFMTGSHTALVSLALFIGLIALGAYSVIRATLQLTQ